MRNLLLIFGLSSLLFLSSALTIPQLKIPGVVLKAFVTAHPTVKKVVWSKEADGFEVEFMEDEKSMSLVYNPVGRLLETETDIPQNQLPQTALSYIKQHYATYKITETARIQKDFVTLYEVELKKGLKTSDLLFNEEGALWRK